MSHNSSFHSFILLLPPSLNHFPAASSPLLPLRLTRFHPLFPPFTPGSVLFPSPHSCIDPLRSPFFPLCSSSVINPSLQACKQKSGDWEEEEAASELPEEPMCLMQGPIHQNGKEKKNFINFTSTFSPQMSDSLPWTAATSTGKTVCSCPALYLLIWVFAPVPQ